MLWIPNKRLFGIASFIVTVSSDITVDLNFKIQVINELI